MLAVAVDFLDAFEVRLVERLGLILPENAGETDDRIERRAQFVAHVRDELAAQLVRLDQFLVRRFEQQRLAVNVFVTERVVQSVRQRVHVIIHKIHRRRVGPLERAEHDHAQRALAENHRHRKDAMQPHPRDAEIHLGQTRALHAVHKHPLLPFHRLAGQTTHRPLATQRRHRVGIDALRTQAHQILPALLEEKKHAHLRARRRHEVTERLVRQRVDFDGRETGEVFAKPGLPRERGRQLFVLSRQFLLRPAQFRLRFFDLVEGSLNFVRHQINRPPQGADGIAFTGLRPRRIFPLTELLRDVRQFLQPPRGFAIHHHHQTQDGDNQRRLEAVAQQFVFVAHGQEHQREQQRK